MTAQLSQARDHARKVSADLAVSQQRIQEATARVSSLQKTIRSLEEKMAKDEVAWKEVLANEILGEQVDDQCLRCLHSAVCFLHFFGH